MLIISKMRYYILKIILVFFYTLICCNPAYSNSEKVTAVELIHSSEQLLKNLIPNEEFNNLDEYIENSRAIILFPEIYEGGLIFGAKGGNGILLIRRSEKEFSGPFFYSIGGVSFGLQRSKISSSLNGNNDK